MAWLGDRYRLVERLGAGGMSEVWRAFDEVLRRPVAVKMLAGDSAANADFRSGIRREAQAAARLTHPRIGVVYDYGESHGRRGSVLPYVVMELIDGPTLSQRLRAGVLPWREALGVCAQVAEGLDAAHARGLVHRDVKPGNVMLSPAGVKVVDFGISAVVGEHADQAADGRLLGTPAYVAPERLIGAPVGTEADVYALGVVLFRSVTERWPWPAEDLARIIAAHLNGVPEPLPSLDGAPGEVQELYLRCLAKDPRERPTAREVATTLAAAAGTASVTLFAVPPGRPAPADESTQLPSAEPDTGSSGLTRVVTTLLPGRAGVPTPEPGGRTLGRREVLGRRVVPGLAAVAVAGLVGVLIVTTTADHNPTPLALGTGGGPQCTVTYRIGTDDGATFSGTLTLNSGVSGQAEDWSIGFDMSNSQTFNAGAPATSTQHGAHVEVHLDGTGNVTAPFTGAYQGTNVMPAAFTADGRTCSPVLIGPSGAVAAPPGASPSSTPDGGAEVAARIGGDEGGKPNKGKGVGPESPGKGKGGDRG